MAIGQHRARGPGAPALVAATVVLLHRRRHRHARATRRPSALSRQYAHVTKAAEDETHRVPDRRLHGHGPADREGARRRHRPLQVAVRRSQGQPEGHRAAGAGGRRPERCTATGVGDIDGDTAVVFIAADWQVKNKSTKGKAQPRYYRLQADHGPQGRQVAHLRPADRELTWLTRPPPPTSLPTRSSAPTARRRSSGGREVPLLPERPDRRSPNPPPVTEPDPVTEPRGRHPAADEPRSPETSDEDGATTARCRRRSTRPSPVASRSWPACGC